MTNRPSAAAPKAAAAGDAQKLAVTSAAAFTTVEVSRQTMAASPHVMGRNNSGVLITSHAVHAATPPSPILFSPKRAVCDELRMTLLLIHLRLETVEQCRQHHLQSCDHH